MNDPMYTPTGMAERIARLEQELTGAHARLAQMAAALRFYADPETHRLQEGPFEFGADGGEKARAALDPDTARAGRMWAALMAEHDILTQKLAVEGSHGFKGASLQEAHAAVEAERKG